MKIEIAIFAAGCFLKPEEIFSKTLGVLKTRVGYIGGKIPNPNYPLVCSGVSGHVEAVEIIFNPKKISYEKLLEIFWEIHNPTEKDKQGVDFGKQYNSMIFYTNAKQKEIAQKSKSKRQKEIGRKIVTEIKPAEKFWSAEEYHQKYFLKHKF